MLYPKLGTMSYSIYRTFLIERKINAAKALTCYQLLSNRRDYHLSPPSNASKSSFSLFLKHPRKKKKTPAKNEDDPKVPVLPTMDSFQMHDYMESEHFCLPEEYDDKSMENVTHQERTVKEDSLSGLLNSYVDLCLFQNNADDAFNMVMYYRNKAEYSTNKTKIQDVGVYNRLLSCYSGTGDVMKINRILTTIKNDQLTPTIQTYVPVMECVAKMKNKDAIGYMFEFFHNDMKSNGFQLNDLLNYGLFVKNQREIIHALIKQQLPAFEPQKYNIDIQYDCQLLNHLNEPIQTELLKKVDEKMMMSDKLKNVINTYLLKRKITNFNHKLLNGTNYFNEKDCYVLNSLDLSEKSLTNMPNLETYDIDVLRGLVKDVKAEKNDQSNEFVKWDDETMKKFIDEQIGVELKGFATVESVNFVNESCENVINARKKLSEMQKQWEKQIRSSLQRELHILNLEVKNQLSHDRTVLQLHACLKALSVDEITQVMTNEIRRLSEASDSFSPTLRFLYKDIGDAFYLRYQMKALKRAGVLDKIVDIYSKYCKWYMDEYNTCGENTKKNFVNPRQYWQALVYANAHGPSVDIKNEKWPMSMNLSVGKFLYDLILRDVKVDVNLLKTHFKEQRLLPAFFTLFRNHGNLITQEVKPHPTVVKLFRDAALPDLMFAANVLPMKCPPRPWSQANTGGYLAMQTDMVRFTGEGFQQLKMINETRLQSLYPSFDSLNQLSAVPWKVNKQVLSLILEVFRKAGDDSLNIPEPPSSLSYPESASANATKKEKYDIFKQRVAVRKRKAEMYSLWCDALYRLSLANHFRNDVFWLPHNMDFRGRVYPVPPHLTHLGSDLARALLVFAKPKEIGPNGVTWLKLHLCNLLGTRKKDSIAERLQYVDTVMDDIEDSADNPLTGRKWWTKSEDPWQTLVCCTEIRNALKLPDPSKYKSHYPVHQDGSCNGLQHYAALGRDEAGAISVNLSISERPNDVYEAVAALVEQRRQADEEAGNNIAKDLKGFIRRKVIKQTVMTTVYGVTRFGARLQIVKQLKDIDDFPKEHIWHASHYLTNATFESIRTMFTSTKEIQDWFTECAKLISGVAGRRVEWITPLGLPVSQPYFKNRKIETKGRNYKATDFYFSEVVERPNTMKQKNAFPPNFIHSLDSSHMMLTSLHCEREGLAFVSVHDCYWTYPANVEVMNRICREQFVALHSLPILEDLSKYLYEKVYLNDICRQGITDRKPNVSFNLLRQIPKTGNFNLDNVLKSVYFFS